MSVKFDLKNSGPTKTQSPSKLMKPSIKKFEKNK